MVEVHRKNAISMDMTYFNMLRWEDRALDASSKIGIEDIIGYDGSLKHVAWTYAAALDPG